MSQCVFPWSHDCPPLSTNYWTSIQIFSIATDVAKNSFWMLVHSHSTHPIIVSSAFQADAWQRFAVIRKPRCKLVKRRHSKKSASDACISRVSRQWRLTRILWSAQFLSPLGGSPQIHFGKRETSIYIHVPDRYCQKSKIGYTILYTLAFSEKSGYTILWLYTLTFWATFYSILYTLTLL